MTHPVNLHTFRKENNFLLLVKGYIESNDNFDQKDLVNCFFSLNNVFYKL